jgi:murein DD-endopeptidase MepM/ murein hydrolase activator NlpD
LAILASLLGQTNLADIAYTAYKTWNIESENRALKQKMTDVQKEITVLEQELQRIFSTHDKVCEVFDLELVNKDVRNVGIGGVNTVSGIESSVWKIERQISFENNNLKKAQFALREKIRRFSHLPVIMPVDGRITSGFGARVHPVLEKTMFHEGIDIAGKKGTLIKSPAAGTVCKIGNEEYAGRYIFIDHGFDYKTFYAHLQDIKVTLGQKVSRYQTIATLGNTGRTTGPHLHYEVRYRNHPQNPDQFLLPSDKVVD